VEYYPEEASSINNESNASELQYEDDQDGDFCKYRKE
jgi:hypothetical protein